MDGPPTADQLHELSRAAYYAVVRAIYASGRLDMIDNELLLTDLQTSLGIKVDEHIAYVEQVHKDEEATRLAAYGDVGGEARGNPSAVPPARTVEMPRVSSMQVPPPIMVPNYSTPFQGQAYTPASSSKPKAKKPSSSNLAPSASGRIIKSATTVKKVRPKQTNAFSPKSAQGKGSKQFVNPSLIRLSEINEREREIFTSLLSMGVKEDDQGLNDVHRALLKWYKADIRQQEIIRLLSTKTN